MGEWTFKDSKEVESSHIVICFESLKKICNFPPNAFNTIKFTQIGKGVGEDMKYLLERGSMFDYEWIKTL